MTNTGSATKFTALEAEMIRVLRDVVAEAQPVPAFLGPALTEHIDTHLPSIERARALLRELGEVA